MRICSLACLQVSRVTWRRRARKAELGIIYLDWLGNQEADASVGDRTRQDPVEFNPLILRPTQEFLVILLHDAVWTGRGGRYC